MEFSNHDDFFFMNYAIRLASRHVGLTGENPSVGCVLVSDRKIISYGITGIGGSPHAEFEALSKLKKIPKDTIAYVSLEPCSHVGKNPACASLLAMSGIVKVVIATKDPNPAINGNGIEILKNAGIKTKLGICEDLAKDSIYGFSQRVNGLHPEVNIKVASYSDGITVPSDKDPWITNNLSRSYGHVLRSNHDAIVVGVNTVKIDDPNLDCRLPGMNQRTPFKVIIDTNLRTPLSSSLVKNAKKNSLIIFTKQLKNNRIIDYKNNGVEVIEVESEVNGLLNLKNVLDKLSLKGFNRVLIEGGSTLSSSFLENNLVNFVYWFKSNEKKVEENFLTNGDKNLNKLIKSSNFKIKDSISLKSNKLEIYKRA